MKLLNLKYKMHKLVNLVFYLIIFGIGFVLGFGVEKINFNKLISQFLFIDNVSAITITEENLAKKNIKFTVNSTGYNVNSLFHLTALIKTDEDTIKGNVVKTIFKGIDCFNVVDSTFGGGTLFSDNTGLLSNGAFVDVISDEQTGHRQIVNGTNIEVIMQDRIFNKTTTEPYIKVPIIIKGNIPFGCTITDLSITINDKEKEIIDLHSFFPTEKVIFEIINNDENTGGDSGGNENEKPGEDNTDEDIEIEIVNSGFYEFAQKIFGGVSEENKFIYDFITFGLVIACFTLFVLVVGYIFNKIFGG